MSELENELRFQPTEEQYKLLLENSEYIDKKIYYDIYYDYPDFRLLKKGIKLRNRNGVFELKIKKTDSANLEFDDVAEIEKNLTEGKQLALFIEKDLVVIMDYIVEREKYRKEGFNIDVDKLNFDYEVCEIELMNDYSNDVKEKIIKFAKRFGIEHREIPSKAEMYLKKNNPKMYQEIYENRKHNRELLLKIK